MSKYQVVPNRCGCHPETCCCNDYAVVDEKGNKYTTCFREAEAEDIARLLNTKTDLAAQPDYKALYQAEQKLRLEAEACADMLRGSQQDTEKVDAQPVAWESTTPTYIRYITEAKYQRLTQNTRAWYRPYRCSLCAQPDPAMAGDDRAAFESWASLEMRYMTDRSASNENNYRVAQTHIAWLAWQASSKRVQPASVEDADLRRFLDAAGSEGYVLDGVDAGDLYFRLFPEAIQQEKP